MRKVFIKRAKARSILAYLLLALALIIIVAGIVLAIYATAKFAIELREAQHSLSYAQKEQQEIIKTIIDNIKFKFGYFLVTLLPMFFFISRTILGLYRYNILKADFYLACADSLVLSKVFNAEQKVNFETLLGTIISEKISLSTPKSPSYSLFPSKDKS